VAYLRALDEALFARRPAGWRVMGFRPRTLVTPFGEIIVERRLYRDERGKPISCWTSIWAGYRAGRRRRRFRRVWWR